MGLPLGRSIAISRNYRPFPANQLKIQKMNGRASSRRSASTSQAIRLRHQQLKASIGEAEAAIFEAHLLILQDPDLINQTRQAIYERHQNAAVAWSDTTAQIAASFRALDDAYLQQRAADVEDVRESGAVCLVW